MSIELLGTIDRMIDDVRADLTKTTMALVNIKSVQSAPLPGAPFGAGPRAVLDAVLAMGKQEGFSCTDHGVGVVSVALKEGQPDLGIWLHGDVVPEGNGWSFPPYDATEYRGHIIGRGAADNKGQLAAIFHLLKIFRELGIELHFNPALYVGSNEETGMKDMCGIPGNPDAQGFVNVCTPPRLSLVPDGSFPVGYGGKGSVKLRLKTKKPLSGWTMTAGQPTTPGRATAVLPTAVVPSSLPKCSVDGCTVTAETPPKHGAHPDPNGNMITNISAALLEAGLIPAEDRAAAEFLKTVSEDIYGDMLNIALSNDEMGALTVFAHRVDCENGHLILSLNVRFPLGIAYEEIVERVSQAADAYGFALYDSVRGTDAYRNDPDSPVTALLCRAANEVTGENGKPYIMSGGTYAHQLPNAYVFGTDANRAPDDFPKGHGGAHGIDESVSLDRLQRAMRIYARALLTLNEAEW